MKIVNPYIKKPENKQWLSDNWETFLDYMSKHHSLADCWHTVLNISSFNDAYVEKIITECEASTKKKIREEKLRKQKISGKKVSTSKDATATEKKIAKMEEAAAKIDEDIDAWGELPD